VNSDSGTQAKSYTFDFRINDRRENLTSDVDDCTTQTVFKVLAAQVEDSL